MPTRKPRMMVTVDDELYERIVEYSTVKGISMSKAATELLMLGLGDNEEKPVAHHHVMPGLSPSDLKFAKEFSDLSTPSKKMVREFVKLEKKRADYMADDPEGNNG